MRTLRIGFVLVCALGCGESMDPDAGADDGSIDPPMPDANVLSDGGMPPPPRTGRCPTDITSDPDVQQALPQIDFDTSYPDMTGDTIAVAAGGDLQAAIDMAAPGDTITIDPGGTYEGPFTLPAKSGEGWIVIRTAAPDSGLPVEGARIDPSYAPVMPDLVVAANAGPVFRATPGAHHYRLVGLELSPTEGSYANSLVDFGPSNASSLDELSHHLVIDRSYLRGDPTAGTRRGVALNAGLAAIVDSYFEGFFELGADSQAIAGWSGSGPYRILNNHLEGASENILIGGADPPIEGLVPSDIEVCGNYFTKPIEWYGMSRVVKNLFELKNARRVLLAGNYLEHNWADGQSGAAILLTVRNQDGAAPWSTIEDVTIARNVLTRTASGVNITGEDDIHPSQQQRRVVIRDNLFLIDNDIFTGAGRAFQITTPERPVIDLSIAHNTVRVNGNSAMTLGDVGVVAEGFLYRDNVTTRAEYGVFGAGRGEGTAALDFYVPGYVFRRNVLIGFDEGRYPADNFFPASDADVGFVDVAAESYRLAPGSAYAGMATDGTDPGANFDLLEAAIAGVVR